MTKPIRKPRVSLNPPAECRDRPYERIIEFTASNGKGGLISIRELADGSVVVEPYRLDNGVGVIAQPSKLIVHSVDTVEWNTLAEKILLENQK